MPAFVYLRIRSHFELHSKVFERRANLEKTGDVTLWEEPLLRLRTFSTFVHRAQGEGSRFRLFSERQQNRKPSPPLAAEQEARSGTAGEWRPFRSAVAWVGGTQDEGAHPTAERDRNRPPPLQPQLRYLHWLGSSLDPNG
jgi:hypothetical protein